MASAMQWKSLVGGKLESLDLPLRLPPDWDVQVRKGASGMQSVVVASPELPHGQRIVGHIQAELRGEVISPEFAYFLGISVPLDEQGFPDPAETETAPAWIAPLRRLHAEVLKGHEERLLVSTSSPLPGRTELGARKLPLAQRFLPDDLQWLAKGYADGWGLGIRSQKRDMDRLEALAGPFVTILLQWHRVETERAG